MKQNQFIQYEEVFSKLVTNHALAKSPYKNAIFIAKIYAYGLLSTKKDFIS